MIELGLAHLTALDLTPSEFVKEAARAGFRSVGLRVHPAVAGGVSYPTQTGSQAHRDLRGILNAEGVRLAEIEFIQLTRDVVISSFASMFEAGANLGAQSVTVSGDDPDSARLTAGFARLCELAAQFRLRVDLEFMRWRAVGTLWQAAAIVRAAGQPNGAVLVDALHLCRSGGTPADLAKIPPRFLRAAQLSDAVADIPAGDAAIIAEAREARLAPGEGALPLTALLQALPADVALSVETPMRGLDARSRIRAAYAATRRLLNDLPRGIPRDGGDPIQRRSAQGVSKGMETIAIGVIGAGLIGRKHLKRIADHPDFNLAGIADVNTDEVAAQNPGARIFADYRKLLDEARPDAVIIASPNQLHAEIGIACARRGIHILIEKPVTDTLAAATDLIAEVGKAGIRSLVGHHRRHHRQVKTLQTLLRERRIGDLVGVSAIWATYKPDNYFTIAPWRTQIGGGPVLINLVHEVDFLRFAVGEIAAVSALASNRRRGFAVEDTAGALIEFENGAIGSFFASDSAVSPWTTEQGVGESPEFPFSGESSYRFMGSRGALEFPNLVQWTQENDAQSWNQPVQAQRIHAPTIDPYVAQLDHFRDVIRGTTPSLQTVEDGARTLIATLAVTRAAVTGQRINLAGDYEALSSAPHHQAQRKAS